MARRGFRRTLQGCLAALGAAALAAGLIALPGAAGADVSAVTGSAFGFYINLGLFGGPAVANGPAPVVTLPAGGSPDPITASQPSGLAQYGPAKFETGPLTVSTQGTTGPSGSVISSARVIGLPDNPGPFIYDDTSSTCTATEGATTGSATIGGGILHTKYDVDTQEPIEIANLPASPAPNTEYFGTIDHLGDNFRIVFNEQSTNADGSLTVNAAHMYLLGPIAIGEMILGQSVCGVAISEAASTTVPDAGLPADPPPAPNTTGALQAGGAGVTSTQPTIAANTLTTQAGVNPTTTIGSSGAGVTTVTPRPSILARTGSSGAVAALAAVILLMGTAVVIGSKWQTSRRLAKGGPSRQ